METLAGWLVQRDAPSSAPLLSLSRARWTGGRQRMLPASQALTKCSCAGLREARRSRCFWPLLLLLLKPAPRCCCCCFISLKGNGARRCLSRWVCPCGAVPPAAALRPAGGTSLAPPCLGWTCRARGHVGRARNVRRRLGGSAQAPLKRPT